MKHEWQMELLFYVFIDIYSIIDWVLESNEKIMKRRKWLVITLLIILGFIGFNMRKKERHLNDKARSSIEEDFYAKHEDLRPFWTGLPLTRSRWDKTSPIIFLHIGKSGGTSFDGAMKQW